MLMLMEMQTAYTTLGYDSLGIDFGERARIVIKLGILAFLVVVIDIALPQELHHDSGTRVGTQGPILVGLSDPEEIFVI